MAVTALMDVLRLKPAEELGSSSPKGSEVPCGLPGPASAQDPHAGMGASQPLGRKADDQHSSQPLLCC